MFCTFTTEHGTLIIRTEDVRRLEDRSGGGCVVEWTPNGTEMCMQYVQGTAQENIDRLRAEELKAIEAAQRLQQRQSSGLPVLPLQRGRQR